MYKIGGSVAVHEPQEALESPVRQVFFVVQAQGRSVGQKNIKAFVAAELIPELPDAEVHLGFRVLVGAFLIPHGSPQSQNADSLVLVDLILDADTAVRGGALVDGVVIAVDVQHRTLEKGGQKGEVQGA